MSNQRVPRYRQQDAEKVREYYDVFLASEPGKYSSLEEFSSRYKPVLSFFQKMGKCGVKILDIGCGSGILGLAAALKNDTTVLGCDISLAAIKASVQNAAFNRMEDRLHLFRGSVDAVSGSFHLVLANLPAAVHMEMFDHYRRLTHPNKGLLIVSGFDDVQTVSIEKELTQRGFMVLERRKIVAWTAALTPEHPFTWVGLGLKKS